MLIKSNDGCIPFSRASSRRWCCESSLSQLTRTLNGIEPSLCYVIIYTNEKSKCLLWSTVCPFDPNITTHTPQMFLVTNDSPIFTFSAISTLLHSPSIDKNTWYSYLALHIQCNLFTNIFLQLDLKDAVPHQLGDVIPQMLYIYLISLFLPSFAQLRSYVGSFGRSLFPCLESESNLKTIQIHRCLHDNENHLISLRPITFLQTHWANQYEQIWK